MDRNEQLLSLYHNLRGEILHADNQNYQVLAFSVAATAALITAGVGQPKPVQQAVVFGLVYLVTWPCQRLLQGNRRRIWRIATYLRSVLEPQLGTVNWESDLAAMSQKLRPRERRAVSTMVAQNEWLVIAILNLTAALCILGFAIIPAQIPVWQRVTGAAAIVLFNGMLSGYSKLKDVRLRRGDRVDSLFDRMWSTHHQSTADSTRTG